jgi:tetratricopeptide (TPR) repeat protein
MFLRIVLPILGFILIIVLVNAPRARGLNGFLHPDLMINFPLASAKAYAERGAKRMLIGYRDGAREDFSEAIKRAPMNADYYCMRAILSAESKDDTAALADCAQAISLDSRCDRAYWLRATIHLRNQNYVAAMNDLDRAIQIDPHKARPYILYSKVYSAQNQPDMAITMLNKAMAVEQRNPDVYLELGRVNFEFDRFDAATTAASKAENLYSESDNKAGRANAKIILDVAKSTRFAMPAKKTKSQPVIVKHDAKPSLDKEAKIQQLVEQAKRCLRQGDQEQAELLRDQANDLIRQLDR